MWETFSWGHSDKVTDRRFYTKKEAEEFIMDIFVRDDLKDIVEWKIAKNNMIIVRENEKQRDGRAL